MKKYLSSSIGRLRLIGFLEGSSLLLLMFIAVPIKYLYDDPRMVDVVGMIHGVLFLLFVLFASIVHFEKNWKFLWTTFKVLFSSFIPFGTFYIDRQILSKISKN